MAKRRYTFSVDDQIDAELVAVLDALTDKRTADHGAFSAAMRRVLRLANVLEILRSTVTLAPLRQERPHVEKSEQVEEQKLDLTKLGFKRRTPK